MAKEWILNQANMRWGLTSAEEKRKVIHNKDVVEEIRREIERLRK